MFISRYWKKPCLEYSSSDRESGEAGEVLCRPLTTYPAREHAGTVRVRVAGTSGVEPEACPAQDAGG